MSAMNATRRNGAPVRNDGTTAQDWQNYHTDARQPAWLRAVLTAVIGLLAIVPAVTSVLDQYARP